MERITVTKFSEEKVQLELPAYFRYGANDIIRIESESQATQVIAYAPDNIAMVKPTGKAVIARYVALEPATVEDWNHAVALFKRYSDDFLAEESIPTRKEASIYDLVR